MIVDIAEIKKLVIGLLNGELTEDGYEIYGMDISDNAVDSAIEMSRRNLLALIGSTVFNDTAKEDTVYSCLIDMSCHRVVLNLMGIQIPIHFYYKTTELTISKTVMPALEAQEEAFRINVRNWLKMLMGTNWTAVGIQDDLVVFDFVYSENAGKDVISKDTDMYNSFLN